MNNFFKKIVLLIGCTLFFISVQAQSSRTSLEDMVSAIKLNRIQDVEKYMQSFVTISINNAQSVYSRNQAQVVLHDFFDKNDAKDMMVMDSGTPSTSSAFVIGSYDAPGSGTKYTVYVLMKTKDGRYYLQEIRINKE